MRHFWCCPLSMKTCFTCVVAQRLPSFQDQPRLSLFPETSVKYIQSIWKLEKLKKMIKMKPATSHRRIGLPSQVALHSPAPGLKLKRFFAFNIFWNMIWVTWALRIYWLEKIFLFDIHDYCYLCPQQVGLLVIPQRNSYLWTNFDNFAAWKLSEFDKYCHCRIPRVFCGKALLEDWGDLRVSQILASLDGLVDPDELIGEKHSQNNVPWIMARID